MSKQKTRFIIVLATLLSFLTASTAFAISSSSPEKPPGEAPYGLSVHGDASGTKLNGVIVISFTDIQCLEDLQPTWGYCSEIGENAAEARVAIRLSKNNANIDENTQSFYLDLGLVPYKDAFKVQEKALTELSPYILEAFFGVALGDESLLGIYLKDFSLLKQANIIHEDPNDTEVEFTAIADITLAVN